MNNSLKECCCKLEQEVGHSILFFFNIGGITLGLHADRRRPGENEKLVNQDRAGRVLK